VTRDGLAIVAASLALGFALFTAFYVAAGGPLP
jgi:hypothetical protein